jgi:amino acid adenylation domain-containing protein/non-ribosomal peptide synthase protein (TIGR01720 family)
MSYISQRIQSLSPEKKELLAQQLKKKGNAFNSFPLSFAQQRLWLLDRLEPGNPSYNISTAVRFRGHLDVAALERSLNAIVQRHESLRTTFAAVQGLPVQVVAPAAKIALPVVDLNGLDGQEREAEMRVQTDREAQHSFDLAEGPLLRISVYRLSEIEHVVLLNTHHIVSDGWSVNVLMRELAAIYAATLAGQPSPLPALPIQYADYAVWQRERLHGKALEQQLSYWRGRLAGAPALLDLPSDRPRPAIQSYRGATERCVLPEALSARLRALSQREGVTLYMTLLAIFQILLHRYTGQEDLVVGTPIANRNRADIEGLIGFFVNALVLRTDLSGDPSFRHLLWRVREVALGAYAHQDLSFDKLVEELSPERNLSHTPLFQVFFNMINLPDQTTKWPELTMDIFAPREVGSKFDLTLYASDGGEGIQLELLYNTDLFDQARALEMLHQFVHLASQVLEAERKISDLSLNTPTAQTILPDPAAPLSDRWEGSVQSLFARQARHTPERLAIVDATESITYQELNALSNRLANDLRGASGITQGDVVAIYGHRSAALVLAVLGVLKAGAAFIILDPAYPAGRLIDYLSMVNLRGWLHIKAAGSVPAELEEFLVTSSCCRRLELPGRSIEVCELLAACSPADPGVVIGPDDLACITFTSGSTGRPKGILQRHGPLSHFLPWQKQYFDLREDDRYSMLAGLAHDPLQREIFTPLCLGGTIYIPAPDNMGTPGWLTRWMHQQEITIAHLTPAMMQLLTQTVPEAAAPGFEILSLRCAFTVGDALTLRDVSRFYKLAPGVTCVNSYGSTETQRAVGYFVVSREGSGAPGDASAVVRSSKEIIPLGQGLCDVQLLVLNRAQQLAGIGELGEIYVRSPHLAKGYLDDEALTRERFITNPFTSRSGDRLYRTGDLGRYRLDGNVEYAGRNDQQVKLRGFRIELSEIEAALGHHPAVKEAVVIAREDTPGNKRLVAYVVPAQSVASMNTELRAFLAKRLPAYMIPAVFVPLEALPLTPNRKVDRQALPIPESSLPASDSAVAPRTATEEQLASIWAKLLGRDRVGIEENFFELGGHSLLATQLMARIYDTFRKEVPLRALFETPTVAGLAAYLEQDGTGLPREERLARDPEELFPPAPIARPSERAEELPLSFAQERLWVLDQLQPGSVLYTIGVAWRMSGVLQVRALERSLNVLIQRHEALRTTFGVKEGQPVQIIAPGLQLALPVVDLCGLDPAEREACASGLTALQGRPSFDLTRGPLLQVSLLKLAADEYVLLVSMHHSISDGWSMSVFKRELIELYQSFCQERPFSLPELPIQYADYALWQRQWLRGKVLEQQLAYWRQQLAGASPLLALPTDRPRPAVQTFAGATLQVLLPTELSAGLQTLSQREGVTLFTTLLAALQTLLARYNGQDDICVGTYIAGRTRLELEPLIGFFINNLALRSDLSDNPPFRTLLKRVSKVAHEAYAHQDVPFEYLLQELQLERSLSHTPLFQVMLIYQNMPREELTLPGLTLEQLEVESTRANFDLSLWVMEERDRLAVTFEYNIDLFEAATIERMARHFQTLLRAIVENPLRRVSALPLLSTSELHQLLDDEQASEADFAHETSVNELFEAQVERTPHAVALMYEEEQLTYGELSRRADQLACWLQSRGVGPEVVVGLCIERSLEMLIGLLGILKAGAAYVPLDPTAPAERLAFMVQETRMPMLLTQKPLLARLSRLPIRLLCLDADELASPADSHARPLAPEQLAYVIYTSGSTGQPKGVAIEHRSLANFTRAASDLFGITCGDRVLQFASLAFDASAEEIYPCLTSGGTLVLRNDTMLSSPSHFVQTCAQWGLSVLDLPTAYWHDLAAALGRQEIRLPADLRLVIIGGEAALAERLAEWQAHSPPSLTLLNTYGPTEATVAATAHRALAHAPEAGQEAALIGHTLPQMYAYVLDTHLHLVPLGVPGELYLGGIGVARGYLGRPDLTAEHFVPDPFSHRPGARLYRTGDVVRRRADGMLEYQGRRDSQIKLRGFRIELAEIEAVLRQQAGVQEAVVLVREGMPGDKRLVAYVVPDQQRPPASTQLRSYLQQRLPAYMLPASFVLLEALPLTTSGKVDRRALPAPDRPFLEQAGVLETLQTPTEELLADIWRQVLHLDQVGRHAHFFELGGHSLLATRVVARVREVLGVELPLRSLFETPTLAGLAGEIERARRRRQPLQTPPLRHGARPTEVPLSYAQQRLWFLEQLEPGSAAYNIALALRLTGRVQVEALQSSLNALVRRHEALRTTFVAHQGRPVQLIAISGSLPLLLVDLSALPAQVRESELLRVAQQEARQPFDLAEGPLFRATLIRLDDEEHALLLSLHHIITDAWSMGVLLQELAVLYRAAVQGEEAHLPELPIQYADYALWQRQWLEDAVEGEVSLVEQQLAYWRDQLSGVPPLLELPTDYPHPPEQTYRGAHYPFALPPGLVCGLRRLSQQEGATLFMTLLAAFGVVLSRWSGQEDLVVGTPIANRTRAEVEGVFGFFVNTLALRLHLSRDLTVRELLRLVREVALGAYARQDLPFERLVDALHPERNLRQTPLFQVMFVQQNAANAALDLPGVRVESLAVESGTARFDLTLSMQEREQEVLGGLEYNTDLFEPATIERMAGHLCTLLEGMVVQHDQPIATLPLFTPAESRQILEEWNETRQSYPQNLCLHDLCEAQAARTPERVALVCEEHHLTYQALHQRATQLAHALHALGVGPETLVGVCLERSLDLVVALLAILKAGGAYVPLDPSSPGERLSFLLQDTHVQLLLTQQHLLERLPPCAARVLCLDQPWPALPAAAATNPALAVGGSHAAYVIYTSGSTGRPKGVINTHQGICNRLLWMQDAYPLSATDRVLQKTPCSFDVSVWEFFWPLLSGACLVLAQPGGQQDPAYLVEVLAREHISVVHFVPAMLRVFLAEASLGRLPGLREVLCSGEALSQQERAAFFRHFGQQGPRLRNLYGPTEAAVDVSSWTCSAGEQGPVPIGRPIANLQLYVLDRRGQPVPIGVAGELYIGGVGVARGYLERPELTAERFVPHPFSRQGGERLYRTGDLVRYRADGALEYLGRLDHQVKLRGFRIELGEIEVTLGQHPDVEQVIVQVREHAAGEQQLVAYVVPHPEQIPSPSELRAFLSRQLPSYMLPAAFIFLEALPLTPNGKLDLRALPEPAGDRPALDTTYVPARTPAEHLLAQIWTQVLGLEQVGLHDNFFELGGDSILSIQIVARATAAGLPLTPRLLFQHQTIAQLVSVIDSVQPAQAQQSIVLGPVQLTPIHHWFFQQALSQPQHWNQALFVQIRQPLAPTVMQRALRALLIHHDALRLRAQPQSDGWQLSQVAPDDQVLLTQVDLAGISGGQQAAVLEEVATALQASLDVTHGPLLRAALFELGASQPARLLLAIHHLAVDIVSWSILLEDLQTACQQLSQGEPVRLPSKTTSFQHWANLLHEYALSPAVHSQLDYWLSLPWQEVLPLPLDFPGGHEVNREGSARNVVVALSEEETQALLTEVPQAYHTQINEVLLTALVQTFARWTGQPSLLVHLEGHGREDLFEEVDLSRTVGWFTSLMPLVLTLPEDQGPGEALKGIKEQVRAVPQNGLGFGLLRYLSQDVTLSEQLAALPPAEISFNYGGRAVIAAEKGLFARALESMGAAHSLVDRRPHVLEISGRIVEGQLYMEWTYSENLHRRSTIEGLAQSYLDALETLIRHCQSPEAGGYTPSDFPEVELSQAELDALVAKLAEAME